MPLLQYQYESEGALAVAIVAWACPTFGSVSQRCQLLLQCAHLRGERSAQLFQLLQILQL